MIFALLKGKGQMIKKLVFVMLKLIIVLNKNMI